MTPQTHSRLKWLSTIGRRPFGTTVAELLELALPVLRVQYFARQSAALSIPFFPEEEREGTTWVNDVEIANEAHRLMARYNEWVAEVNALDSSARSKAKALADQTLT
jgi:hypothetical protein